MYDLRHWQPVMPVQKIGRKPVTARIGGHEIVLFRSARGDIGALADRCPHRGMRLSKGWVEGERLVCPYHGWSYAVTGEGVSPASESMRVCATPFDVACRHRMVWVKATRVQSALPQFEFPGFHLSHVIHYIVPAPLELLVDNLIEMEHSCTGHWLFGFDREDMSKVELRTDRTDEGIHVVCTGPQKRLPRLAELALGIRSGDEFVGEWMIHLAPVHTVYTFTYANPKTGALRDPKAKAVAYFSAVSDEESRLTVFYFTNLPQALLHRLLVMPLFRRWIDYEYELDRRLLANIADRHTDLGGFRLGRFDKPLIEFRRAMREMSMTHDQ